MFIVGLNILLPKFFYEGERIILDSHNSLAYNAMKTKSKFPRFKLLDHSFETKNIKLSTPN